MFKTTAIFLLLISITFFAQARPSTDSLPNTTMVSLPTAATPFSLLQAPVAANFSVQHLPFFCDKEFKLEKLTKIPIRFRLGSVAYCDRLEGKNH